MERDTPGGPVKWITKQTDKVSDVSRIGNTKKEWYVVVTVHSIIHTRRGRRN